LEDEVWNDPVHNAPCILVSHRRTGAPGLNRRISDGITDMKNMTSLNVLKRPFNIDWREKRNIDMPTAWAYLNSTERDVNSKQKEGWNFRRTKVDWSRLSSGIYIYARPFHIESKGKSSAETCHFEQINGGMRNNRVRLVNSDSVESAEEGKGL
jgi:hypothetical protein